MSGHRSRNGGIEIVDAVPIHYHQQPPQQYYSHQAPAPAAAYPQPRYAGRTPPPPPAEYSHSAHSHRTPPPGDYYTHAPSHGHRSYRTSPPPAAPVDHYFSPQPHHSSPHLSPHHTPAAGIYAPAPSPQVSYVHHAASQQQQQQQHVPAPPPPHPATDRINKWRASVTPEPPRARDEYGTYNPDSCSCSEGEEEDAGEDLGDGADEEEEDFEFIRGPGSAIASPVAQDFVHISPAPAPPGMPPQLKHYPTYPGMPLPSSASQSQSPSYYYDERPRRTATAPARPQMMQAPRPRAYRRPSREYYEGSESEDEYDAPPPPRRSRRTGRRDPAMGRQAVRERDLDAEINALAVKLDRVRSDPYAMKALSEATSGEMGRRGMTFPKLSG